MVKPIDAIFPGLRTSSFRVTSAATREYNCIGWAAGDTARWWWPDPDPDAAAYWPSSAPLKETVDAFVAAFATLGYVTCSGEHVESGFEKVALFVADGVPTHAVRQRPNGAGQVSWAFERTLNTTCTPLAVRSTEQWHASQAAFGCGIGALAHRVVIMQHAQAIDRVVDLNNAPEFLSFDAAYLALFVVGPTANLIEFWWNKGKARPVQ